MATRKTFIKFRSDVRIQPKQLANLYARIFATNTTLARPLEFRAILGWRV